jgi:hypothetical protein
MNRREREKKGTEEKCKENKNIIRGKKNLERPEQKRREWKRK